MQDWLSSLPWGEIPFWQGEMAEPREKWQKLARNFQMCLF